MEQGKKEIRKQIKICGLTCEKDVEYMNAYEPDFVGFVLFFPKSKRNLTIEKAKKLRKSVNKGIQTVAVTVSPTEEQVREIEKAGFDYIQIHGALHSKVYEKIRLPILRAFNVTDLEAFEAMKDLEKIKGYVFDAKTPGSGETFDWTLLQNIKRDGKWFFLAGGIDESNVIEAIHEVNPDGIDVSSAVENPDVDGKCGGKNEEKIKTIIRMVHDEK